VQVLVPQLPLTAQLPWMTAQPPLPLFDEQPNPIRKAAKTAGKTHER